MNKTERLEQVENIFHAAIECEPSEAAKFVAEACTGDDALRSEVESLLAIYVQGDKYLNKPVTSLSAFEVADFVLKNQEDQLIGRSFGNYRVVKKIGSGGTSIVYLAARDDSQYEKRVAVKLLKKGMETDAAAERFRQERQILADLEHPNIARLIDGGTTESGFPYLVMEYVEGLPIDRYCDIHELSIDELLKLFNEVCSAIQFAHQNLIVHRDLKPGNILITEQGVPKILDFGIAKAINEGIYSRNMTTTITELRIMTPEYASPEQVRGEKITAASDIYSLGVLLYELLTGRRPYYFKSKSLFDIVKVVCETEPEKPSEAVKTRHKEIPPNDELHLSLKAKSRRLAGDLENILLKALRKEPKRRYVSVAEFSEDIQRHLKGLPVKARKDTIYYQATKFFKRHRVSILSSFAVALVFLWLGFSLNLFSRSAVVVNESNNLKSFQDIYRAFPIEKKKGGTNNVEAHNLYLTAQWLWEQRTLGSIREAKELFRQATEKDQEFALAYSGLSNSYFLLSVWGKTPANEIFPQAKAASLKAIELAPEAAEGHLSLAVVYWLYEFDWQAADREFKKAVELNPDYARGPHWYGLFLAEMGRFDEAIATEKRALTLEPQSLPVKADLARVLFYARRYDESLAHYREILDKNPNFGAVYTELLQLYEAAGMEKEWESLNIKAGGFDNPSLREAYEKGGMTGLWRKEVEITENAGKSMGYPTAILYAKLNDKDRAFELLNKALESRAHAMAQIKVHPSLDNLRSDPRFQELLKRMNLDD